MKIMNIYKRSYWKTENSYRKVVEEDDHSFFVLEYERIDDFHVRFFHSKFDLK